MVRTYPAIQFWLEGAGRTDVLEKVCRYENEYQTVCAVLPRGGGQA